MTHDESERRDATVSPATIETTTRIFTPTIVTIDRAIEIDEALPVTPRKTMPTFSIGPVEFMPPTDATGSYLAFRRDERANVVPISEQERFAAAWHAAGKEVGPDALPPPTDIVDR